LRERKRFGGKKARSTIGEEKEGKERKRLGFAEKKPGGRNEGGTEIIKRANGEGGTRPKKVLQCRRMTRGHKTIQDKQDSRGGH